MPCYQAYAQHSNSIWIKLTLWRIHFFRAVLFLSYTCITRPYAYVVPQCMQQFNRKKKDVYEFPNSFYDLFIPYCVPSSKFMLFYSSTFLLTCIMGYSMEDFYTDITNNEWSPGHILHLCNSLGFLKLEMHCPIIHTQWMCQSHIIRTQEPMLGLTIYGSYFGYIVGYREGNAFDSNIKFHSWNMKLWIMAAITCVDDVASALEWQMS